MKEYFGKVKSVRKTADGKTYSTIVVRNQDNLNYRLIVPEKMEVNQKIKIVMSILEPPQPILAS
jgi:hypothetical protein